VVDEQKAALKKAAGVSGGKDECQVRLKGRERNYWMGTEIGMLGGYGFQGQVTAGDGLDKQGKMGAGCNNLRSRCCICVTTSHCRRQSIDGLVKVERQR